MSSSSSSPSILTILHLIVPPLLLLPLIHLAFPARSDGSDDAIPGIRPIKVRLITPRRGLILTLLSSLALTSVLDFTILIVDLLTVSHRGAGAPGARRPLDLASAIVWSFGGFLIWAGAAIISEWRAKWGNGAVVVIGTIGLVAEIANLPLIVIREMHSESGFRIFNILSIPPSCLRIILLLTLLAAASSPRVSYEDATESTGLLNGNDDAHVDAHATEVSTVPRGRLAYGTFGNDNGNSTPNAKAGASSRATSQAPATANASGTQTPAGPAKPVSKLTIPKKLGEKEEKDRPLSWKEFWPKLKKLSPHLWPSTSPKLQFQCLLCILIIILARFLTPLVPISLGQLVRALTNYQVAGGASIWPPFITYFSIRAVMTGGVLDFARSWLWIPVYQYTDREMMMLCFNHLLNLSLAYHTKRNTGEVMRIIDRGSAINNLFQTLLFTAIPTVIDIVIAFGILYWLYGPIIALVTLVTMTTYISVSFTATKKRVGLRRQLMERDVKQRGIVNDVLTNWESVKYFTAEQREQTRFREAVVSYQDIEARWTITYSLLNLVQTFLLTFGLMVGSLLIALRVLRGQADAAEFVVFIQYFAQLSRPLDNLGSLYRSLNTNTTDAEKMFNLLAQATEVNDKPGAKDLIVTDGIIEFDNVRFSYDDKVEALKGVSFKIGKGQSMALVGESGSGKSTILRLLYRFYDITSGHIYIDGQDIANVTQLSLRRAIGIVPQDSVLWNDTIGANVSYGKEDATDEEIIAAAEAARLHEKISGFPDGYSTIVGERGVRLSGGEKQRVSLARMFLKSPAILVLDEATSALDTETEREIQRALADLAKGRSSLSIAHRLSTIINSDQIVVMKDGQIVEHGDYKELLELNGPFATMWRKQIHTEAEMLSQAEAGDAEVVGLLLDNAISGTQADTGSTPDNTAGGNDASTQGFEVREALEDTQNDDPTTAVSAPTTYAEAVKVDAEGATSLPEEPAKDVEPVPEPVPEPKAKEPTPATYAEAVLAPAASSSTDAEAPQASVPQVPDSVSVPEASESAPPVAPGEPQTPSKPVDQPLPADVIPVSESKTLQSSLSPGSTPSRPDPTPTKSRPQSVTFPNSLPRPAISQSASQRSLDRQSSSASGAGAVPSRSNSTQRLDDPEEVSASIGDGGDDKKDKRRKRLSSIKGFVRRISDQGGLSRSSSTSSRGGLASPEVGEDGDDKDGKKKKRLSLARGNSMKG